MSTGLQEFYAKSAEKSEKAIKEFRLMVGAIVMGQEVPSREIDTKCKAAGVTPDELRQEHEKALAAYQNHGVMEESRQSFAQADRWLAWVTAEFDEIRRLENEAVRAVVSVESRRFLVQSSLEMTRRAVETAQNAYSAARRELRMVASDYGFDTPPDLPPLPSCKLGYGTIDRADWDRLLHGPVVKAVDALRHQARVPFDGDPANVLGLLDKPAAIPPSPPQTAEPPVSPGAPRSEMTGPVSALPTDGPAVTTKAPASIDPADFLR